MRTRDRLPAQPAALPEPILGLHDIWWDPSLFVSEDTPDNRCSTAPIDITGRARYLFFGPYLPLSDGSWRARVWLDLCPEAASWPMALQFGTEPDYTTEEIPLGTSGRIEVSVSHVFAGSGSAQIRLWLKTAAFHGSVRFHGAALSLGGDS
jgi:hypothetical protein